MKGSECQCRGAFWLRGSRGCVPDVETEPVVGTAWGPEEPKSFGDQKKLVQPKKTGEEPILGETLFSTR